MLKKKLTLIIMCSLFFPSREHLPKKKKRKADKNAITVDSKAADAKKEPKPYKKVIDSTADTQKD
jgi:hypothetical protein